MVDKLLDALALALLLLAGAAAEVGLLALIWAAGKLSLYLHGML